MIYIFLSYAFANIKLQCITKSKYPLIFISSSCGEDKIFFPLEEFKVGVVEHGQILAHLYTAAYNEQWQHTVNAL